jgi:serine/threonine-protein kinase
MSPEQAAGDLDRLGPRSDVYSLGATLYCLLTSRPPFQGDAFDVLPRVQRGEVARPRQVDPSIDPALEAVCLKAMATEPADRYASCRALADDLDRWMADEPVTAWREPLSRRARRWGRRNRTLAASLSALPITAVVALSVGIVLVDRERAKTEQQRQIADQQRQIAEEQRELADANAARALHNLRLAQDAAAGLLAEVADVDLADIPQMEPVRQRLLEKARAGYQQFLVQQGDDPRVRRGAIRSHVRLADIQALLGDVPRAEATYRQAIADLEDVAKQSPGTADDRRDLARAVHGLGVLLKDANRFQQGEAALQRAIELRQGFAGRPDATAEDKLALADSQYQLGSLLARSGTGRAKDEAAYRAALEVQEGLLKQNGDRPEYRTRLARYRNNLAILQKATGHPSDAEATLRATLGQLAPSLEGPEKLPGPRWQFARAANNLGSLLLRDRRDEAGTLLRRARELLRTLAAEFPSVPQYDLELSTVEYNLGFLAGLEGHPEQAVASYREAARLLEPLRSRFPGMPAYRMKLATAEVVLGAALAKSAPAEARETLAKALREQMTLLAEHPDVPEYQRNAGEGHSQFVRLLAKDSPGEAIGHYEEAVALYRQVIQAYPDSGQDRHRLAEIRVALADALIAAGRIPDAGSVAEQIPAALPADPHTDIHAASLLTRCASAAARAGDGKMREDFLGRAVIVLRKAVGAHVIRSRSMLDLPDLHPLHEREDFKQLRESLAESVRSG